MKKSERLWQYYEFEPALKVDGNVIDFLNDNNYSVSFKFKEQIITEQTGNNRTKNVEIIVPLKYLSNFSRILEMALIVKFVLC